MTYSNVKPDSGPSPALDVAQIRTNFSQFDSVFSVNHTSLNNPNQGNHENVVFVKQTQDPGVTQDLSVLYAKDSISHASTEPQLFVQIPKFLPTQNDTNNADNDPMQLTYNAVNTAGPQYQSFLIGKYLIYFGSTSNIAFPIVLSPTPTNLLVAIATANTLKSGSVPFAVATSITGTDTFTIISDATGVYSFCWIAVALA